MTNGSGLSRLCLGAFRAPETISATFAFLFIEINATLILFSLKSGAAAAESEQDIVEEMEGKRGAPRAGAARAGAFPAGRGPLKYFRAAGAQ